MSTAVKTWRILDILKVTEAAFAEKGIKNPRLNAELLLAETTGESRFSLYLNFEKPLTESEVSDYREKVKRRLKHEPLQYILGKAGFYGMDLMVNPYVLIPRQETEILVEKVLEYIKSSNTAMPKILEIGTGSGCISAAVAANCECSVTAIDISAEAVELAKENAALNNLNGKVQFITRDFFDTGLTFEGYDIIVSNPPYISAADVPGLNEEVNAYEPYIALTDSGDGLSFYKRIFELYNSSVNKPAVFLEIGDGKKESIVKLLSESNIGEYNIHRDLIKLPRVLEINSKAKQ